MAETKVTTEMIETDRHTWRECTLCHSILEEKVFSKVVKEFQEVQLSPDKLEKSTKKELEQATRKYKIGDEYQWFGYSLGGQHTCDTTKDDLEKFILENENPEIILRKLTEIGYTNKQQLHNSLNNAVVLNKVLQIIKQNEELVKKISLEGEAKYEGEENI